jgi:hypothetical protein
MNNQINPKNLDALLNIVGSKLNIPPETLRKQLEAGEFDKAINGMNPNDAVKFRQIMNNPKLAEQLMSAPQAQALYKKIMGK